MNELIQISLFSVLAIAMIMLAASVIGKKSVVYSALCLGLLGMVNAGLFALLGYSFVSVFHLAVHVGAAVMFILFCVTMFRDLPSIEVPTKVIAAITIPAIALVLGYLYLPYLENTFSSQHFPYKEISSVFIKMYWFPLVITGLALVTTLIEGITLARMEVQENA